MKLTIVGLPLDSLTVDQLHAEINRIVRDGSRARILNLNAHAVVLAHQDSRLHQAFSSAELVFCDGAGVRLAALLAGHFIPPRITYADWTWQFAEYSSTHGLSWYLLGGVPGRAEAAARALQLRFPALKIAGAEHGFFDKHPDSADSHAVRDRIAAARPDVLFVGFGMPVQELWIEENWGALTVPIALAGGAVFDYVAGVTPRAPAWLRAIGMEWLGRLWHEPGRLWRRYLLGLPLFLLFSGWYAAIAWTGRLTASLASRNHDRR